MQWLLLSMILLMPFEKSPYLRFGDSFLSFFPDFTAIKLLGLIGLVLVFWLVLTGQSRLRLWQFPSSRIFLVFLGILAVAALFSGAGPRSLTRYLGLTLFLPIMLVAIQSENDVRKALSVCVGVMILTAPYAYRQVLRFGGRMGVGLYEPNYYAIALVLLLPLALVIAMQQVSWGKRAFWWIGAGMLFGCLILAGSRGGFVGALVSLGIFFMRMTHRRVLVPLIAIASLFAIVLIVPSTLSQRLMATLNPHVADAGVQASNEAHLDLLYAGISMIEANPIFGVGLGKFHEMSSVYFDVAKNRIAHNTFIHLGAESGIPAILAFLLLLGYVSHSLLRSGRLALEHGRTDVYEWTIAMQAGLTGYMLSACFISAQFEKFFWAIIFLSMALERVFAIAAPPQPTMESPTWTEA